MTISKDLDKSKTEYKVIGTRPIRHDGTDKVTGRALYGADYYPTGLIYGKVLRSPYAHANIQSIDTSKAEKLPGVFSIVTGNDLEDPGDDDDLKYSRNNILAADKALYKGHAIAAIAAVNIHVAEEALSLIDVQYEELEPVLTVQQAMPSTAPLLHPELLTEEMGEKTKTKSNIANHYQHKLGDIVAGFNDADYIVEREFNTETVHQGYIEPHNSTAFWNSDGKLNIWCSTQGAFNLRESVADVLGIEVSQIKVTPLEIGGGFGGKIPSYLDAVTALLSKKSNRPVKIVMTRKEVFECTGPTSGCMVKVKVGVTKEGKITAGHAYIAFEAGAFPGSPVDMACECIFAAYSVPNSLIDGYDVVVNKPKTEPYRAPGSPNAAFAMEQIINELAEKTGIDPIDLRLLNASKKGTRRAAGPTFPRIGLVEVLTQMKNHPHYKTPLKGKYTGRGVAVGYWFNIGMESSVNISVNKDGTISLVEGSTDIGGSRSSIAMQAAEVLGIRAEDVKPSIVDTDSIGFTFLTGGSRTTYATGWAAYKAAEDVKEQLLSRVAKIWDVNKSTVSFDSGTFASVNGTHKTMSFKELAAELPDTGGTIVGRGTVELGMGGNGGGSFAGNIVDVEIDPETGKTAVTRFTVFQDAGKAIHPSYVEGQMQGGSAQGIGWALNEEYFMNSSGSMDNSTLLDYRMPTALDLPMIEAVIVEVPSESHPFGVRGVGEANIVPPMAAIANALKEAVGVRFERLPMKPEVIVKALQNNSG